MKRWLLVSILGVLLSGSAQAELIGHYTFDTDASDSSGKGNDGTAEGDATLADGLVGGAMQFSGAGHVVVPIDSNPTVVEDMTVTMWVKPDESIAGTPGLYKTFGHDDGGWDRTFGLDNREGEYRYTAFTGGARPGPSATTGEAVTSDWTFLAAVWDTNGDVTGFGSDSVQFFVNGASVTEALINTSSVHTTSAIGNLRPDNFSEGFVGLIDEVQIYDHALSAAEIDAIRTSVPEPMGLSMLSIGAIGLLSLARRRR